MYILGETMMFLHLIEFVGVGVFLFKLTCSSCPMDRWSELCQRLLLNFGPMGS